MPLTDLLPARLRERGRRQPAPVLVPATTGPAANVVPARSGFVTGVGPQGTTERDIEQPSSGSQDRGTFLQELWEEYLACPWAWSCVNAIARTVTAGGLVMKWDSDTGEGDQKQPPKPAEVLAFERLVSFTNPKQNIRQLMRCVVADLQVFGDAFIEVVWLGRLPVALFNLDCPTTTPITDPHGGVTKYVQVTQFGQRAEFAPHQVIHISLDSARPSVLGISPTHAAEQSIVTWMFLAACEKEAARRGLPPNIHTDLPAGMSDTDVELWQDKYVTRNLGPQNAGTPVTTKGGGKVNELQREKLTDIIAAKKGARDEIVSSYGVPPAKVGIIESGNLGGGTGSDQNKALDLMTVIPTPTGWTTMGELEPGDQVLDENGKPCNVVSTHEVPDASSWRLRFSDGTHIDCCLDHLWVTWTWPDRKAYGRALGTTEHNAIPENWPQWRSGRGLGPQIRRTEEVLATLYRPSDGAPNHSIPLTGPLELPAADLPLDPYVLGAWLGDGTAKQASITCGNGDEQILDEIRAAGYRVTERTSSRNSGRCPAYGINGRFLEQLRAADLLGNKHVPARYLRASRDQRLALLHGLMDTDGGWAGAGQVVFVSSLECLADAVMELARSLGQKPVKAKRRVTVKGIEYSPSFRVTWTPTIQPFRLLRKAERFARTAKRHAGMRACQRMIVGAEKIADRPMRCIKVDSPNAMYLAGEGMIPTHNTWFLDIINPVAWLVAEALQFHLAVQAFGIQGWHAEFGSVDYRDDQTIENIRDMRIRNGVWTVNRGRADVGEPSVKGGDDPVIIARQDIVLVADLGDRSKAGIAALNGGPTPAGPGTTSPGKSGPAPTGGAGPAGQNELAATVAAAVVAELRNNSPGGGLVEHTATLTARQRVWNQLSRSFPARTLEWVQDEDVSTWDGPTWVPLDQVDTAGARDWAATHDGPDVKRLRRQLRRRGKFRPVVLVRTPGDSKYLIVDGHHHTLAAIAEGHHTVRAWVGRVHEDTGPWTTLPTRQHRKAETVGVA